MEAHDAEANRALTQRRVAGTLHAVRRDGDEVCQDVVEEAQHILDEARHLVPRMPRLDVERGETAHRGALLVAVVDAGRQRDLAAQVGGRDFQPELALMPRHRAIDAVDEQEIRLAGLQPRLEDALPQLARVYLAYGGAGLRAAQREFLAVAHRLHERVGDVDAVVQVEALAVEVARGLADLQELLDLRVVDVEIDCGRTAPQRALADRERQPVHHMDERNNAGGLARALYRLADRAHPAPVGADAAAVRGEPDVLVPGLDDAVERIRHCVEEARDRQSAR